MNILQDLWSDTAGRIFLITVVSYLFGYMIYGGYVYTFFGRRGSLPVGLADFSIADLISIFPVAIITLINIIPKAIFKILKGLFIHFGIPVIFGVVIRFVLNFQLSTILSDTVLIGYLARTGFSIWIFGYLLAIVHPKKIPLFIFFGMENLGMILFFTAISNSSVPPVNSPILSGDALQIMNAGLAILFILELIALPFAFGIGIAETAIKSNLLIKINRLILRQPILEGGMKKVKALSETKKKNSLPELWLAQRNLPIDIAPDAYEWLSTPDNCLYLIATFEKFALIFVPGITAQDNSTIIMSRDVIMSIEISHKTEPKTH